jgi:hypothetical protein
MTVSPFFHDLCTAYQAELDDLTFDSEGGDVLRKRLADKRKEIGFLVCMMELSPEMVAVVFHQGLSFRHPAVMDHLLSHEADEFPQWSSIADSVEMTSWAHELTQVVLKEARGEWFMTVVAGLEYMAGRKVSSLAVQNGDDEADETDDDAEDGRNDGDDGFGDESEAETEGGARARREAGDDWMAEQGFDRKD